MKLVLMMLCSLIVGADAFATVLPGTGCLQGSCPQGYCQKIPPAPLPDNVETAFCCYKPKPPQGPTGCAPQSPNGCFLDTANRCVYSQNGVIAPCGNPQLQDKCCHPSSSSSSSTSSSSSSACPTMPGCTYSPAVNACTKNGAVCGVYINGCCRPNT